MWEKAARAPREAQPTTPHPRCSRNNTSIPFFFAVHPARGHIKEKCKGRRERGCSPDPQSPVVPRTKRGVKKWILETIRINKSLLFLLYLLHAAQTSFKRGSSRKNHPASLQRMKHLVPLLRTLRRSEDCLGFVSCSSSATSTLQQLFNVRVHISSQRDIHTEGLDGRREVQTDPQFFFFFALNRTSSVIIFGLNLDSYNVFEHRTQGGDLKCFSKTFFFFRFLNTCV